ncbi:hypothetical protein N0V93_003411 [Gnomoniopsis smithogilvyi]|uniref:Uncharacterized protein n=1 Tax=Gnomoniopsis smithogilvyi TaxID=1191159 RepID=A0A9W8YYA6_9PEZI|nr:hypothetical protein N0V93_003411 [Gnomoniopsis smithogilvyi]
MPIFEPLTEVQKEFLPIVNDFLSRADTQGLHCIVEKHIRDTEKLQGTFEMLKGTVERLQRESEGLRASNEKCSLETEKLRVSNERYSRDAEKLQATVETLQSSVQNFQGAHEELRISNAKSQASPKEFIEKVNAIKEKLAVDLENIVNNLETKTRTANEDLSSRIGQLHNSARAALKDLQKQIHELDARQQHSEQAMDQVANAIHDVQVSLDLQEARTGRSQNPHAQSSYGSRKRPHGYDREEDLADPRYGEGFKRHARDKFQDDTDSRPANLIKQPPHLARQDAAKVQNWRTQQINSGGAPPRANNQPEISNSINSDDINPRFEAIKAHYNAAKAIFNASQPKDQRSFIWKFIEGSGDVEFCTWFQEHLLEVLPSGKVTRSSKKPRHQGDRLIALTRSLTWEEVRRVVRDIPNSLPPFLE